MTRRLTLAHVVQLHTIGGVERSYCQFIGHRLPEPGAEHHTVLAGRRIASGLERSVFEHSETVFLLKAAGGIPLPRRPAFLRANHLRRRLGRIAPDALVFWSIPKYLDAVDETVFKGPVIYYERGASWLKAAKDRAAMGRLLAKADGIVCNSNAARRVLELRWRLPETIGIHVVLNAVRPDCLSGAACPRDGLDGGRAVRLGVAGRLVNLKGIPLALQVLAILRTSIDAELWIAGTGPERESLERLAGDLGIAPHVRFLGLVSDMGAFYRDIDILVCPSIREPFGLVCAEAMAFGCPVIGARVDGIPEVVSHGETGFCVDPSIPVSRYPEWGGHSGKLPEVVYDPVTDRLVPPRLIDPRSAAERVFELVADADLYRRMSRAGRDAAAARFSFDRHAREVVGAFSRIVDRAGPFGGSPPSSGPLHPDASR